jgi:dephospho-CoA kinase
VLIGITGTIGSGKSIVSGYLGEMLEAEVLSADEICRQELHKGRAGYREVVRTWGKAYLDEAEEIDRVLLREQVFKHPSVRYKLECILHPLVRERLLQAKAEAGRTGFVVAEVPLLFESGWQSDFDWVVLVHARSEQTLERVAHRDGAGVAEIQQIISVQMDAEQKKALSDSVIDNSASLSVTRKQVRALAWLLQDEFSIHSARK